MKKLKLLLIVFLVGFSLASWAQSKVPGKVTDEQNMPIPGVSVLVKGTSKGTVTDFDGNYTISVKKGGVVTFSYLGFQTKEVTFNGESSLDVQLKEDTSQLDEIVVIGYGSVKKTDLTGSVASLSADNLTKQKKTDVGQAIKGQVTN